MKRAKVSACAESVTTSGARGFPVSWLLLGVGAPAAAIAFVLATGDARDALAQGWPPFALVAGLLLIGAAAGAEGLFEAAGRAGRLGGGGATQLVGSLLLVALVTAILNLDTAVVFLTPVLLHLARSRGLDDEPFLYGVVLMANAGSLFLPGSNLTNLIVLAHEDVGGAVFAARMLPAALASVAVTALVLTLVYRTRLARREAGDDGGAPFRPGAGSAGVVAAVILVLALQEPALPVLALGVVVAIASPRLHTGVALDALSARSLAGLLGIVVALGTIARSWTWPAHTLATIGSWPTAAIGAGAALALNNLPAAALLSAHAPAHPRALLVGLNLGPNLAATGSLSAFLWWQAARAAGARPSLRRYTQLGLAVAPASIAAALIALRLFAPGGL